MKKPNLIFDLDDTIFDSLPLLVEFMNQTWGINSTPDDYRNPNSLHLIVQKYRNDNFISYEQVYDTYRDGFSLSELWHERIMLIPYAGEVIPKLASKYRLHIATKRSSQSSIIVGKVINKHIPNCIESVYYAIKYIKGYGHLYQKKKDFVYGLDGESIAFVDDSPFEIEEMGNIIPSYLFDPKNNHPKREMNKIRGWKEVEAIFL